MNGTIKSSLYLPDEKHRRLKMVSAARGVSLQKLFEQAIETLLETQSDGTAEPQTSLQPLSAKEIREWLFKLKRILESRNELAILTCTSTIRAMELWLAERKLGDSAAISVEVARRDIPAAAALAKTVGGRRPKT